MTRVLIADDNPTNLYLLESILKGNGYSVSQAKNGAEALASALENPPDLIITDILMPVMDGFELCRRWKADEHLREIPVIFYTATYTDPRDEKFALSLGAERYILKPQKPDILLLMIREVLDDAGTKKDPVVAVPLDDEMEVLRQYNEVLFRKLERKLAQLENEIAVRKAAEYQRETVIRKLEQKNAELSRFTYTVSHELRSPLITIQGFAGMLLEEIDRDGDRSRLKNHVGRITTAVNTLDRLLSDLVKLSRAGRRISPPKPVDFGIIAREAADLFSPPYTLQGARIEVDPAFPEVLADRDRIREVLVNLLENSLRFRGGQTDLVIRIGVDTEGNDPVFFVRDNGRGIEPCYLERVFNIFEKLDGTSNGTGIGLAISRRIIEAHGGRIWAESAGPGNGTTVKFTLPAPA